MTFGKHSDHRRKESNACDGQVSTPTSLGLGTCREMASAASRSDGEGVSRGDGGEGGLQWGRAVPAVTVHSAGVQMEGKCRRTTPAPPWSWSWDLLPLTAELQDSHQPMASRVLRPLPDSHTNGFFDSPRFGLGLSLITDIPGPSWQMPCHGLLSLQKCGNPFY
jgi:hypothetical protein